MPTALSICFVQGAAKSDALKTQAVNLDANGRAACGTGTVTGWEARVPPRGGQSGSPTVGHVDDSWPAVARFAASGAKAGTCDFELSCNGQFLNEVFRCNLFLV